MIKNTAEKDTLIFTFTNGKALAINRQYYEKNTKQFISYNIANCNEVYYQFSDDPTKLIDYKKALMLSTGTYNERIEKAINDKTLFVNIFNISEMDYYDIDGYKHTISPFNGFYKTPKWIKKVIYNEPSIIKEMKIIDNEHLIIEFIDSINIDDCLISLNTLFYQYEKIAFNKIIYRNIRDQLPKTILFEVEKLMTEIEVYSWYDITKEKPFTPIDKENGWLVFNKEVANDMVIIYNGVLYHYIVNQIDKRKIKLIDVSETNFDIMKLDRILCYRFISKINGMQVRLYVSRGISNRIQNTVDFALPVVDSLITVNGIDNFYEVFSENSISFNNNPFSVTNLSNLSFVSAINFIQG